MYRVQIESRLSVTLDGGPLELSVYIRSTVYTSKDFDLTFLRAGLDPTGLRVFPSLLDCSIHFDRQTAVQQE